jgi:hypothetical protein
MKKPKRPQYNIKRGIKFKNRLNGESITGDLINEEDIEGKSYFVIRNDKGSVVKLTKEAYSIQK